MKLSVVIPAYCDKLRIVKHVDACAAVSRLPDEVIVADDCGPEGTAEALRGRAWPFRLLYARILKDIPWNQPGARNLGLLLATGDAISFEDVDHLPARRFYAEAEKRLHESTETALIRAMRTHAADTSKRLPPSPGSWIVRRDAMLDVGGYDEDFSGHYGCDDDDARARLTRRFPRGAGLLQEPGHLVIREAGTRGLKRDAAQNHDLLKRKARRSVSTGAMLRFPFSVSILQERKA